MKKNTFIEATNFKWFLKEVFLTWQLIAWVAILILLMLLLLNKININSIKAGSFEFAFEQKSKDLNVYNTPEFNSVKNLNENQLKLFLIMGGEEASFYRFTNTALKNEASVSEFIALQKDSLLRIEILSKDTTMISPTITGSKLHKALIQSIYSHVIK